MRRVSAPTDRVVVIGAGCSALIDELLDDGYRDVTAVDVSATALDQLVGLLGERAKQVTRVVVDVRDYQPDGPVDLWHDRATFHFLVDPVDQRQYARRAAAAIRPGGHLLLAGFAPDGPEQCSGLDVARHSTDSIMDLFGSHFDVEDSFEHEHLTPSASTQRFLHVVLRRRSAT